MQILWIPLILLLLLLLEQHLYQIYWDRGLQLRLRFARTSSMQMDEDSASIQNLCAVTEGESVYLLEEITNRNFLPFPLLQIHYQLRNGLTFDGQIKAVSTDRTMLTDIFSLGFYEKITRPVLIREGRRGYYHIMQAQVNTDDLFHFRHYMCDSDQGTMLYVYPKLLTGESVEIPFRHILGDVTTRQYLYEDPFTFRGIREYRPGDPERSVNWKASARSGDLQVNVYDHTAGQEVMILLNLEDPAILYNSELLENGIRLAHTYASRLMERQIATGLTTNGLDCIHKTPLRLNAGSTMQHQRAFAEALSRIDTSLRPEGFAQQLHDLALEADHAQTTYVLISSAAGDLLREEASHLADAAHGLFWICPQTADMQDVKVQERGITFLPILFH